jgi:drug/metabolite transporter (DMT)-like permease
MRPAYGSNLKLGVLITCLAFLSFTGKDACVKWVGSHSTVTETYAIMSASSLLTIFLPLALRGKRDFLQTSHLRLHLLRGFLNIGQFGLLIYALRSVELSNFYSLIFASPIVVRLMSQLFFKDRLNYQSWIATLVGFAGVLIVIRPSHAINVGQICILISIFMYSVDVMVVRHTSHQDRSSAITFYRTLSALPWAIVFTIFDYKPLPINDVLWLILSGTLAGIGSMALVEGFRLASAPRAAPFQYTQLLWSLPLGYFVWHEIPDTYTWIGGAVIIASGLYLLRHESRAAKVVT